MYTYRVGFIYRVKQDGPSGLGASDIDEDPADFVSDVEDGELPVPGPFGAFAAPTEVPAGDELRLTLADKVSMALACAFGTSG